MRTDAADLALLVAQRDAAERTDEGRRLERRRRGRIARVALFERAPLRGRDLDQIGGLLHLLGEVIAPGTLAAARRARRREQPLDLAEERFHRGGPGEHGARARLPGPR